MKAVRVTTPGGLEALQVVDVPDPVPGPGELTLDIKAAGVNHLDLWVRRGLPVAKYPMILGSDAAGIVRETGRRALLSPATSCGTCEFCASGDKPLCVKYTIYGEHVNGTDAQSICVPAENLISFPDTLSFEEAAAVPLVYLTAWRMLITRGRLAPSEDVLIWSAGAGVGVACLQLAKLAGARVIATASSDEKCARLRDLGADFVLNHAREDVARRLRELTAKRGVDVVVDYIGKDTWARSVQCVRRGGRIVTCGATSGHDPVEDLRQIFFRQIEVIGCTMGNNKELQDALRPVFEGRIRPVIDSVLPLSEVAAAHSRIEQRAAFGKIILKP
ncbi:MAG: zinc-binding dehydrogenase [Planctomycetes bacterium]|nr:zinc-binding dehydrogenase [Planctomycetota bacterium]